MAEGEDGARAGYEGLLVCVDWVDVGDARSGLGGSKSLLQLSRPGLLPSMIVWSPSVSLAQLVKRSSSVSLLSARSFPLLALPMPKPKNSWMGKGGGIGFALFLCALLRLRPKLLGVDAVWSLRSCWCCW
jgi:hypothetical protein